MTTISKKDVDKSMETFLCSCCQAKAKFRVNENYSCGRHLGYLVVAHTVGSLSPRVEVLNPR